MTDESNSALRAWAEAAEAERWAALEAATRVLRVRQSKGLSPFDGDLTGLADRTANQFRAERAWSASRLEAYRTCPFLFFTQNVLGLEPRPDAVEGLMVHDALAAWRFPDQLFERWAEARSRNYGLTDAAQTADAVRKTARLLARAGQHDLLRYLENKAVGYRTGRRLQAAFTVPHPPPALSNWKEKGQQ